MKKRTFSLFLSLAVLFSAGDAAAKTLHRTVDAVVLTARGCGPLLGRPISSLRAYAMAASGLAPIPLQIDERNAKGQLVFPFGPKAGKDEDGGRLDANDEIVFMARDAGDPADKTSFPAGWQAAVSLEITDPVDGGKAWVYLLAFDNPPPPAAADYVRYDPANNMIYATNYTMGFDKKAPIGIGYLALTPQGGGDGKNYVDRLKIRFTANMFGGRLKFERNEEEFTCKVVAWIDGPVRVIRHTQNRVLVLLNIPSPSAMLDNVYYANQFEFPTEVSVPFDPRTVISDPRFTVTTDALCGFPGGTYRNEKNPRPVTIDGVMSPEEKALDRSPYKWMVATMMPPYRGAWLNRVAFDKRFGVSPNLFYLDDRNAADPPENDPGQCGNVGYTIDIMIDPKKGDLRGNSVMYNIPDFSDDQIPGILNILDRPLVVTPGGVR